MPKNSPRKTTTLTFANVRWHTASVEAIQAAFSPDNFRETVKQNRLRTVEAIRPNADSPPIYYLKHDHGRGFGDRIKRALRSKVRQEFQSSMLLKRHGIPCIDYVAWGQKGTEGFLLTTACPNAEPLENAWAQLRDKEAQRRMLVEQSVQLLAAMWKANIFHPDLHLGNILAVQEQNHFRLELLDVYGIRKVRNISKNQQLRMTSIFMSIYHDLSLSEIRYLIRRVAELFEEDPGEFHKRFVRAFRCRCNAYRRKRRHKYLHESSLTTCLRTASGIWRLAKDRPEWLDKDFAERAVQQHRQRVESNTTILKNDRKRRLSRYHENGHSVIVKEFLAVRRLSRWASDTRSWLSAFGLRQFGIPVCRYYGWFRSSGGAFILMEDLGSRNVYHELLPSNDDREHRKQLLQRAGRIIGDLHNLGIFHRDLKITNFLAHETSESAINVKLVDLDAVSFYNRVPRRYRTRNLKQVCESLPQELPHRLSLYLLAQYNRTVAQVAQLGL